MREARDVPWLGKRDGVFNVFWYVPPTADEKAANPNAKGRTERRGLRTRDADIARDRYTAFLQAGEAALDRFARDAGLIVADALDDYYREHVAAKDDKGRPNVADPRRQADAIRNLKAFFGRDLMSSIDIPRCRAYKLARRAGQIGGGARHTGDRKRGSDATVKRELNVLKAAARHAQRWKRIPLDKMPTFEMPSEEHDGQEAPWLTKDQVAALFAKCDEAIAMHRMLGEDAKALRVQQLRDWMELTYWWGARRKSIERLHVSQVSLEQGTVNLQKAGARVTKKRRPIVPVFPQMQATVERLASMSAETDGWLFGRTADFYRPFRRLCRACGIAGDWPHVLRHTRATHMLMDGGNPYKVAKLLGDTLTTVLRVYGHACPDFLKEDAVA